MSQHDYSIANAGFPATRADINNVLSAIATNNSGTSAPSTQYAGQFWIDTTSSTWTLYIHDGADDIQFATIDTSANTVNFIDSELGDNSVTTAKIADGNVTSAKLSYPLTTFSSTGIDDNATSTAITIDSSQNVGIAGNINLGDNDRAYFGTGNDLEIYHDGSNSYIKETGTGNLGIQSNGTEIQISKTPFEHMIRAIPDGAVKLYHDNSEKLETTSTGIAITGGVALGGTGTANTLDDYEEGTFTPRVTDGTTDWTGDGFYRKTGSLVFVQIALYGAVPAALYGSASNITLTDFPFSIPSGTEYYFYVPFTPFNVNSPNTYGAWGIYFKGTASGADIRWFNDNAGPTDLVGTDLNSNSIIRMGFSYITD